MRLIFAVLVEDRSSDRQYIPDSAIRSDDAEFRVSLALFADSFPQCGFDCRQILGINRCRPFFIRH